MLSINGNTASVTSSPPASILNVDINKVSAKQPAPVMQSRPPLLELPDELETELLLRLISGRALTQSAQSLGNLGLSCTHWSLRVRKYIDSADGQALRRDVEVARFRKMHRMLPVDLYRDAISTTHRIFYDFPPHAQKNESTAIAYLNSCSTDLTNSDSLVHLYICSGVHWLNEEICNGLATRGNKLTILEFSGLTKAGLDQLITAIQQVPYGGFVALRIDVDDKLSTDDANKLFAAIAAHPVVCHLTLSAKKSPEGDLHACTWMAAIAKHNTCIESVEIDVKTIEVQKAKLLAKAIKELNGIRELEIIEEEASIQSTNILFDAVRDRNAANSSKLTLYYSPTNHEELFADSVSDIAFSDTQITIRKPGEVWVIEPDALPMQEESPEEDQSIEVGSYSSGDDAVGSQYKWAGDSDSDVIVESSDESED